MRIWFDTEFIEDGRTVDLLSIGMVREDGATYYAEPAETDRDRADKVYEGVEPLTGEDIAEAIAWCAQLPAHMNVNDMVLMPAQQAGAYYTCRKQTEKK